MNHSQFRVGFRRRLVATSIAALLLIAGGIGHALAQDDEDDELPDTKFFKSMLRGFGLRNGQENGGISYQERPPLVVPPTRDLPPPQSDAVKNNPQWPTDQDEKRRREAAAKRKREAKTFSWDDLGRQLSPNEMRANTASAKDQAMRRNGNDQVEQHQRQMKPDELGFTGAVFGGVHDFFVGNNKDETTTFEAEPPRASLTDPPTGYRSPSPAQPYGLRANTSKAKPMTQEDRVTQGADQAH